MPLLNPQEALDGCPSVDISAVNVSLYVEKILVKCAKFPQGKSFERYNVTHSPKQFREVMATTLGCAGCRFNRVVPEVDRREQMIAQLHARIQSGCGNAFRDGHFILASLCGFILVKERLREISGYERANEAVGKGGLIFLGAPAEDVFDDFQQTARFTLMAIDFARNTIAHSDMTSPLGQPIEMQETLGFTDLMLASKGMRILDNTTISNRVTS